MTATTGNAVMLDIKKLITEVKRRPAIYDNNCIHYNDRHAKSDAWNEVCVAMVANWNELTTEEKNVEEKILRNKWRNTRDYFMKEFRAPRKRKNGSKAGRKRKTNTYHNELLFLLPTLKNRLDFRTNASKSNSAVRPLKDEVDIHEVIELESSPPPEEFSLTGVSLAESEPQTDVYQHQVAAVEASMATLDNEIPTEVLATNHGNQRTFNSESDDDDYDRMFLLSLLPSLRCVPEHMKLHVRIQMQQVIASAFHPSNHHAE